MKRWSLLLAIAACSNNDFESSTTVSSVRILATHASQSSPAPGDSIVIDRLAFDGRAAKPRPMALYWIPEPCIDPADDGYYQCYPAMRAAYPVGVDVTSRLSNAPTYGVTVPADVIERHGSTRGVAPYGQIVVFSIACAGHVEAVPPTNQPEALPFGCFDENRKPLGPDDFMFAYTTIFVYAGQKNADPKISALRHQGVPVDVGAGITVDHCQTARLADCPTTDLDIDVPPDAQELNPRNVSLGGDVLHEQVYVSYFVTAGKVEDAAEVIYDPRDGRLPKTTDKLYAPQVAGDYQLWAVLHDDRGGVSWMTVPLHAR